jgi:hypothetical protein
VLFKISVVVNLSEDSKVAFLNHLIVNFYHKGALLHLKEVLLEAMELKDLEHHKEDFKAALVHHKEDSKAALVHHKEDSKMALVHHKEDSKAALVHHKEDSKVALVHHKEDSKVALVHHKEDSKVVLMVLYLTIIMV